MNHPYLAQQERDALLLGQRVAWAIFAENEPIVYRWDYGDHIDPTKIRMVVNRAFATVRARAYQAGKGKI
jgi:hypothetical protein